MITIKATEAAKKTLQKHRRKYPRLSALWKSFDEGFKARRLARIAPSGFLVPTDFGAVLVDEIHNWKPKVPSTIRHYLPKGGFARRARGVRFVGRRIVAGPTILKIYDEERKLLWRYASNEIAVRVEVYTSKGKLLDSIIPGPR